MDLSATVALSVFSVLWSPAQELIFVLNFETPDVGGGREGGLIAECLRDGSDLTVYDKEMRLARIFMLGWSFVRSTLWPVYHMQCGDPRFKIKSDFGIHLVSTRDTDYQLRMIKFVQSDRLNSNQA